MSGVDAFWARARVACGLAVDLPVPCAESFGDTPAMADELLQAVINGPKRATAGAYDEYLAAGEALPLAGDLWVVLDGTDRPRALLRTTEVRIGPLSSVDDAFAWDEGEGDRTRATWLADHRAFFTRTLPAIGVAFHDAIPVVFERFELLYTE